MIRWMSLALAMLTMVAWAQNDEKPNDQASLELQQLRQRVAALEQLVRILQAELTELKRNETASSNVSVQLAAIQQQAEDEKRKLEEELERELQQQPSQPRPTPSDGVVVFGGGAWQGLNPDTSVIANFRAAFRGKRPFSNFGGSEFSEAELAFQAATDPFSRLDTFIAITPHGAEVEEATLTILDPSFLGLPKGLQVRLGKLIAPFGQLNTIHPPEQPFTDTPLVYRMWFGHEHGGNERIRKRHDDDHHVPNEHHLQNEHHVPAEGMFTGTGLSLNWLLPTGKNVTWLTVAPLNVHNPTFDANAGRPVWMTRVRTMRELSLTQSLGLGLNYAFGRNDTGNDTRLFGVDVTYRWRPIREGMYRSLVWQTEAFWGQRKTGNGKVSPKGFFSLVEYQLSRTLFLGARYDFAQAADKSFSGRGFSLALTLFPSEFGRYRLQWSRLKLGGETVHEFWLQTTFSIGVHRPHPL